MYDGAVVGRALDIVQCIAATGSGLSLARLAEGTRIPKPTVRRIALDLVARGVLVRRDHVYTLGPTLEQLGRRAALHRAFAEVHESLVELNATFGGVAWLLAGEQVKIMEPFDLVCSDEVARFLDRWPPPSLESMVNTAGGRLFLLDHPDLLEQATQNGVPRWTPNSPATRLELDGILRQTRDLGAAVESEQSMIGWRCVAVRLTGPQGQPAAVGVTVPVQRGDFPSLIRSVLRVADALPGGGRVTQ